eukprot:TRINITY_DN7095_c0_g1_i2.p2 TRINITY_DN7095_c0_g1~~TRINITY_DN7095_c0_g1_i2.p2  ORF type:complete len:1232 (+),score=367.53 TRINITY_DN7095_c0_g1_i2:3770-7465(+)
MIALLMGLRTSWLSWKKKARQVKRMRKVEEMEKQEGLERARERTHVIETHDSIINGLEDELAELEAEHSVVEDKVQVEEEIKFLKELIANEKAVYQKILKEGRMRERAYIERRLRFEEAQQDPVQTLQDEVARHIIKGKQRRRDIITRMMGSDKTAVKVVRAAGERKRKKARQRMQNLAEKSRSETDQGVKTELEQQLAEEELLALEEEELEEHTVREIERSMTDRTEQMHAEVDADEDDDASSSDEDTDEDGLDLENDDFSAASWTSTVHVLERSRKVRAKKLKRATRIHDDEEDKEHRREERFVERLHNKRKQDAASRRRILERALCMTPEGTEEHKELQKKIKSVIDSSDVADKEMQQEAETMRARRQQELDLRKEKQNRYEKYRRVQEEEQRRLYKAQNHKEVIAAGKERITVEEEEEKKLRFESAARRNSKARRESRGGEYDVGGSFSKKGGGGFSRGMRFGGSIDEYQSAWDGLPTYNQMPTAKRHVMLSKQKGDKAWEMYMEDLARDKEHRASERAKRLDQLEKQQLERDLSWKEWLRNQKLQNLKAERERLQRLRELADKQAEWRRELELRMALRATKEDTERKRLMLFIKNRNKRVMEFLKMRQTVAEQAREENQRRRLEREKQRQERFRAQELSVVRSRQKQSTERLMKQRAQRDAKGTQNSSLGVETRLAREERLEEQRQRTQRQEYEAKLEAEKKLARDKMLALLRRKLETFDSNKEDTGGCEINSMEMEERAKERERMALEIASREARLLQRVERDKMAAETRRSTLLEQHNRNLQSNAQRPAAQIYAGVQTQETQEQSKEPAGVGASSYSPFIITSYGGGQRKSVQKGEAATSQDSVAESTGGAFPPGWDEYDDAPELANTSWRLESEEYAEREAEYKKLNMSVKDIYLSECRRCKMKPNSMFVKTVCDTDGSYTMKELDLSCNYIASMKPFLDIVRMNKSLRSINVRDNGLDNSDLRLLCETLQDHPGVEEIDVSGNRQLTIIAGRCLLALVQARSEMEHVKVSSTSVPSHVARQIASHLEWNRLGREITPERVEAVAGLFDVIDLNGDGVISVAEVDAYEKQARQRLSRLTSHSTQDERVLEKLKRKLLARDVFKVGQDPSRITFAEFLQFAFPHCRRHEVLHAAAHRPVPPSTLPSIKRRTSRAPVQYSVSSNEIKEFFDCYAEGDPPGLTLQKLAEGLAEPDVDKLRPIFMTYDTDQDDVLTLEEFSQFMESF